MITTNQPRHSVRAVLRHNMIVNGETRNKGEVEVFKANDFKYLENFERVAEDTPENVAAIKAEIAAEKAMQEKETVRIDDLSNLKLQLAAALAEIEKLKKGK
jgi:hypothetical protein